MSKIKIYVPKGIKGYTADLQWFVGNMVRKMHINRHKNTIKYELADAQKGLQSEVMEMERAYNDEGQFEYAMECVDVANMAMLCAREALSEPKNQWKNRQKRALEIRNRKYRAPVFSTKETPPLPEIFKG